MVHRGEDLLQRKDALDRKGVEFLIKHGVRIFSEDDFVRKLDKPWFDASDEFSAVHAPGLHIDDHTTLPVPHFSHVENFFSKLVKYQKQIDREKAGPLKGLSFRLEDNEPLHVKLSSWKWLQAFLDISEMFPGTIIWGGRLGRLNAQDVADKSVPV